MSVETQEFVENLLREFRQLVLEVQEEHCDLKGKLSELSLDRNNNKRSSTRVATTASTTITNSTPSTVSSTVATTNTTNALNISAPTASPTDDHPETNTLSSGTLSSSQPASNSTRPPPYKSVIRNLTFHPSPPKPPARTRRRTTSTTLTTNSTMSSNGVTRGALIVLEGLDRVGKSTLAKKLVEHLERTKRPVSYCRFPDRKTPIGSLIDEYLRCGSKQVDDHAMHLLFSANRWELSKHIRSTIMQGTTLIIDRYSYSGIAYSSAKRDLSIEWCLQTEKGLPKPDMVIYLELPRDTQYKRPGFGDERFETEELQELIRVQYDKLMDISPDTWLRIDVENKTPDQILGEIIIPVKRCLESSAIKKLGKLEFL